jgi:hypothetical protein
MTLKRSYIGFLSRLRSYWNCFWTKPNEGVRNLYPLVGTVAAIVGLAALWSSSKEILVVNPFSSYGSFYVGSSCAPYNNTPTAKRTSDNQDQKASELSSASVANEQASAYDAPAKQAGIKNESWQPIVVNNGLQNHPTITWSTVTVIADATSVKSTPIRKGRGDRRRGSQQNPTFDWTAVTVVM